MDERAKRGRNCRRFSLEGLEGRNLLSVLRPAAVAAERVLVPGPPTPVTHIHGFVSGSRASDPLYGVLPATFLGYSGHGVARPFGNVLFGVRFVAAPNITPAGSSTVSQGNVLMITVKGGDQLRLNFTGTNQNGAHGLQYWSWTGTVASGTGRFLNATGTFTATGAIPRFGPGQFNLDLRITANPPV
jgi:hypothetical protein